MLTQTTETAIRALIYLALKNSPAPVRPKLIAQEIGLSPTYLAKITRLLAKANILRSHRGTHGGVTLSREPSDITLLSIVEACQGRILEDFCEDIGVEVSCGFHKAMRSLYLSIVNMLSSCSLSDLSHIQCAAAELTQTRKCRMYMDPAAWNDGVRRIAG